MIIQCDTVRTLLYYSQFYIERKNTQRLVYSASRKCRLHRVRPVSGQEF